MSRLASVSDFRREIAAVEALIAEQEALVREHGIDFSTELLMESLRSRKDELQRELEALGDEGLPGQELAVVVKGAPVSGGAVEADFLGTLLKDVQGLIRSIVAAQFGSERRQGAWEPEIKRRSTLRFADSFAGSFGMVLEAVDEQLELEGRLAIQPAFEDMFQVLSSTAEGGSFLESLAPLGPRARSRLRKLLEHISAAEADVSFQWPVVQGRVEASVSKRKAQALVDALRRIDETETLETITGMLEGAILRTGYFEIQTDAGEVVGGRVAPPIRKAVAPFFGKQVRATVITTTVTDHGTGEQKTTYRLVELDPA